MQLRIFLNSLKYCFDLLCHIYICFSRQTYCPVFEKLKKYQFYQCASMVTFTSNNGLAKECTFKKTHFFSFFFFLSQTNIRAHIMDSSSVKLNPNTCTKIFVKASNHMEKIASTFMFPI